jgi:hypothetical protein
VSAAGHHDSELARLLDDLAQRGARVTPEGWYAVLDVIAKLKSRHSSVGWQRLRKKYPDLASKVRLHQFPGPRQRPTPVIAPADVRYLVLAITSKVRAARKPEEKPKPPLLALLACRHEALVPDDASAREGPYPAPYGWRWHHRADVLVPIRAEHQTLSYARKLRAFGSTVPEIIRQLERDGITPRGGGAWGEEELFDLLEYDHAPHWKAWETFAG